MLRNLPLYIRGDAGRAKNVATYGAVTLAA